MFFNIFLGYNFKKYLAFYGFYKFRNLKIATYFDKILLF